MARRMTAILQPTPPPGVLDAAKRRLPGVQPLEMAQWLMQDAAFAPQMALRDHLIRRQTNAVLAQVPGAEPAVEELTDLLLGVLRGQLGYHCHLDKIRRPDGGEVVLGQGMATLGRLVAEDLCVMEKPKGASEHLLTAAVLCFPASWTLAEKIGHPLTRIHAPVKPYDGGVAARVQRLFDGVQPGRPLWRSNALRYASPDLHQPRSEQGRRDKETGPFPYLRTERQCLIRLPQTQAVVFSIHTSVVRLSSEEGEQVHMGEHQKEP